MLTGGWCDYCNSDRSVDYLLGFKFFPSEMESNTNGYGSFLNLFDANSLEVDHLDPMYKVFLEHLRMDGRSYILEIMDGNEGLPVFLKYEKEDALSDFLHLNAHISSGYGSFARKRKLNSRKKYISKKSKAQSCKAVDFSGFDENQIEKSLAVEGFVEYMSTRNLAQMEFDRCLDLLVKDHVESNMVDESYQEFLSCLIVQDGLMVMEHNSVRVIYEGNEMNHTTEGLACSGRQELVLYENSLSPDLVICEADDMALENPCNLSPFDLKLMAALNKPYDKNEHEALWKQANYRKPVLRHKDLRSQSKSFSTRQMGFSYLDHFPELAKKLDSSDPQCSLALLRGLFFWLKNLCHEGSYQPWIPSNPHKVEDLDQEMILPFDDPVVVSEASFPRLIL